MINCKNNQRYLKINFIENVGDISQNSHPSKYQTKCSLSKNHIQGYLQRIRL